MAILRRGLGFEHGRVPGCGRPFECANPDAICSPARNQTNDQLRATSGSDGMVGLNFTVAFSREDGKMLADVPIGQMLWHLDYWIGILGEDRVGLGSDYDGAVVPEDLTDASGLAKLRHATKAQGYEEDLIMKLCHGSWLCVLEKTWGG